MDQNWIRNVPKLRLKLDQNWTKSELKLGKTGLDLNQNQPNWTKSGLEWNQKLGQTGLNLN